MSQSPPKPTKAPDKQMSPGMKTKKKFRKTHGAKGLLHH